MNFSDLEPRTGLVRAVVADDHPVFREGMIRALRDTGRYAIVGEAADGRAALEQIAAERPDVALLDLRMPELDGLGVLQQLARNGLQVPVVLLTAFSHPELIAEARAAGAAGLLAKDATREEIIAALDTAAAGGEPMPGPAPDGRPRLMDVELMLLSLLHAGWSMRELPTVADLPRPQIDRYLNDAARKLAAGDVAEAVARAAAWRMLPDLDAPDW